jgi:hypothetical protein
MFTRLKYLCLYVRWQLTVYRQDHDRWHTFEFRDTVGYQETCGLYVLLSCHENKDVTRAILEVDSECLLNCSVYIVF